MAEYEFKVSTPPGQKAGRHLYLVYGNSGTYTSPKWNAIGKYVEESSAENDYSEETSVDILGDTHGSIKKPVITQSFDPCPVDSADEYQQKLIQLAIVEQDVQALANQDLLRVHMYLKNDEGDAFADRYPSSMVLPNGPGGEGGGDLTMPVDVTFGGSREVGTAKLTDSGVVFTKRGE